MVLRELQSRYRQLARITEKEMAQIELLAEKITHSLKSGKKLYVFGSDDGSPQAQYLSNQISASFDTYQYQCSTSIVNSNLSTFFCISTKVSDEDFTSKLIGQIVQEGDITLSLGNTGNLQNALRELKAAKRQGGVTALIAGSDLEIDQEAADFVVNFGNIETTVTRETQLILMNILIETIEVKMGFKNVKQNISKPYIFHDYEFDVLSIKEWKTIVWVNGCFDILHEGHLLLLRSASRLGTHTIVGINSDDSVKKLKGENRPIISEINRARMLSQLPYVDAVVIFSETSPLEILKRIQPKIVVKGAVYKDKEFPEKEFLQQIGCEIIFTEHLSGLSTSKIIENSSI